MYALIIAIHAVFFFITYFLWYNILAGIFIILWVFFLFYFSPLFFQERSETQIISQGPLASFRELWVYFSPQKSIFLPVTLLYIALYGFLFSIFWSRENFIFLHSIIILGPYIIGVGYIFAFSWKEKIFFDIFRFHTLFTLITTIIITIFSFIYWFQTIFLLILITLSGVLAATFFLSIQTDENPLFIYIYLLWILLLFSLFFQWIFGNILLFGLMSVCVIWSIMSFETCSFINLYKPYSTPIRYFSLLLTIVLTPALYYTTFSFPSESIILLSILLVFFLSIHKRYGNSIVYILWLSTLYFIYSFLFFWLLQSGQIFSVAIFLFFLPLVLIGLTYFIDESHEYDFMILHYSSIGFSILFSLYSVFFIGWWADLLFLISLCIFGVALLFFLSYFYFYNRQKTN